VQQAALRGLEGFGRFDRARSFKAWWFAILRNCCIDLLRRSKAFPIESLDGIDVPGAEEAEPPEWQRLDAALRRLPGQQQDILRLRYFGEMSYRELAEALDIPQGTVMSRLHVARRALAAQFREED
jgi:RNA polymerase sigma-70 factor (ECF subfamily)